MFTSRLPKSTSARRPSNPDGSTSMFGSNIPVSVRKANLFTPQPKRSLQAGLSSTSRKSYMTSEKKYQRPSKPVPDRDEQIRMFDRLVNFLKDHAPGFPIPEAKRFFSSVSTTETSRIFEFLISQLYPDFKINKLELDVPEALALLEYPYIRSVTKSALVSITTRQAIVNLLVIFDWLITECEDAFEPPAWDAYQDFSSPGAIIACMVNNPATPADEMKRLMQDRARSSSSAYDGLEKINHEYEQLTVKVKEMEERELIKQTLSEDVEKNSKYCEEFYKYLTVKQAEADNNDQEEMRLEAEVENREKDLPIVDLVTEERFSFNHLQQSIPRLEETLASNERSLKSKKHNHEAENIQLLNRHKKVEQDFLRLHEKVQLEELRLTKLLESERNKCDLETKQFAKMDALDGEYLRGVLEGNKQQIIASLKNVESERDNWAQVARTIKENNKVAKKAFKKLAS